MKRSVNAWAISDKLGFEETFSKVKAAGFDAIELNVDSAGAHALTPDFSDADCARVAALSEQYALPISGISTSMAGNIASDDPAQVEDALKILRKQISCARALSCPAILTVPGAGDTPWGKAQENCARVFSGLKSEIEQSGITVCAEHVWNGFFLSPRDLAYVVDEVASERFRVYFDIGNCADRSKSEDWIRFLGDRIAKVHIKNFNRISVFQFAFVPLYETGTIDFKAVLAALREIGYDGTLTAEYGAPEGDPSEELQRNAAAILEIMKGETK